MISSGLIAFVRKVFFSCIYLLDFEFEKKVVFTIKLEISLLPELARRRGIIGVDGLLVVLLTKEKCSFTGRFGMIIN